MDIHRVFAEVVALVDGKVTRLGRVDMRRDRLEIFTKEGQHLAARYGSE
jgi:transposase